LMGPERKGGHSECVIRGKERFNEVGEKKRERYNRLLYKGTRGGTNPTRSVVQRKLGERARQSERKK